MTTVSPYQFGRVTQRDDPPFHVLRWWPTHRANPNSTLRGHADVQLPSGLIIRDISICVHSSGTVLVFIPSRLSVDLNNQPLMPHRWRKVVDFATPETKRRFDEHVVAALLDAHPDAFG
jgi:hypothetical protein